MDKKDVLERKLIEASKRLSESSGRSAVAAENEYGQVYQELVRAGYRQQIRYKYRVTKG